MAHLNASRVIFLESGPDNFVSLSPGASCSDGPVVLVTLGSVALLGVDLVSTPCIAWPGGSRHPGMLMSLGIRRQERRRGWVGYTR